jgi:hypothetical protein
MSAENKLRRQILENDAHEKRPPKNESKIIQHGKSGGFILSDSRTGWPGNSAKVGAVGKIHFVQ